MEVHVGEEILLICKGELFSFLRSHIVKVFHIPHSLLLDFLLHLRPLSAATPEGEITWRKDGNTIDDDETVKPIDGLSSSLNIKTATLQDAGTYICECEFDNGHNDIARSMVFVYGV